VAGSGAHSARQNTVSEHGPARPMLDGAKHRNSAARSAAPESISRDAEVMVLGRHGYEIAFKGKNGFVCIVQRSWTAGIDDPDFWNPKLRAAICFNARTYLPITIKKTELVLAGRSKAQMFEGIKIAFDKKERPPLESGAMCYMTSKQSYLSDHDGHWHPHLMFFVPLTGSAAWGQTCRVPQF
jgi:hypothetical protein